MREHNGDEPLLPYFQENIDYSDRLVVTFRGGEAESGSFPLRDLFDSLNGLEEAVYLCELLVLESRVPTRGQFQRRPQIFVVRAMRPGTFNVDINWLAIAALAFGPYLHSGVEAVRKMLWKKLVAIVASHLENRAKGSRASDYAEMLATILSESSSNMIDRKDLLDAVFQIDIALEKTTRPLRSQATEIVVANERVEEKISFSSSHREAFIGDIPSDTEELLEDLVKMDVVFTRINRNTGRGLLVVGNSSEGRQEWFEIIDPIVHAADDPYTAAFAKNIPIRVMAYQMRPYGLTVNPVWKIVRSVEED